jgi:hypothetical protein
MTRTKEPVDAGPFDDHEAAETWLDWSPATFWGDESVTLLDAEGEAVAYYHGKF